MKLHLPLIFLSLLIIHILNAATPITIHLYNPWVDNTYRLDSVYISGNQEVQYYPGTKMESEGAGWFTYTFKTMPVNNGDGFDFFSYIGNQYDAWSKKAQFPDSLITFNKLSTMFAGSTEFWVIPVDSTKKYNIYNIPPDAKVIHLFNPWPDNSPQIIISGAKARRMQVNTNLCGWYTYYYAGFVDSLKEVSFTDYFNTAKYMSGGLVGGKPLDLTSTFATHDTIYILPKPFPAGPPYISTTFPGKLGECPTRKISAIIRDWKVDGISFFADGTFSGQKVIKGMVENKLSADGKPVATAIASQGHASELNTWFVTKNNNQTCRDLTFTKGYDGRWAFDSDLLGGFFPIDDFNPWNDKLYQGDDKRMHNFHFTMEMHMQFAYHKGTNQTFMFRGDDDVWIFVNGVLAIDLGNLHNASTNDAAGRINSSDTLRLDNPAVVSKLGLTDNGNYPMDIFYCERQPSGSNLFIETSLDLRSSEELFYKDTLLGTGKTKYDIRQIHKSEGLSCGFTPTTEEEAAIVNFSLDGPQFQGTAVSLPPGTQYGGIIVDQSKSTVTIDSAAVTGLSPGIYTLTFTSTLDPNRSGFLTFNVGGKYPASLFADPPDGTHFTGKTDITLSTDKDALIYFTTDGSAPDTNNAAQLYSTPITIDKALTIKAIAIGKDYIPTSGTFKYIRDPQTIALTANPPSGTHFIKDTTITLTASNGARIYYTIDGSNPDTNNTSQLYSAPFTITTVKTNASITVKAVATGNYLVPISKSWTYTRDFPSATLTATPGDGTHFGESLSITLSTNADAIYYTIDGSEPVEGSNAQLYKDPFTITNTAVVKAIAAGKDFTSVSKQWRYTSDRIPNIQAHPGTSAFSKPISVILTVSDVSAKIYYTLDGSEPTINSSLYNGPITISTTTQLKARAFASNKVPSVILIENYTRKSIPQDASYYDCNADGTIDSVSVKLDLKASTIPDSLLLSAYGGLVNRTVKAAQIKLSDDGLSIFAVIDQPMSSERSKDNDAGSGILQGLLFDDAGFLIKDKVAPVLQSAVFTPDLLEENMSKLGTLKIKFSESIKLSNSEYPFNFYQDGTQYRLKLNLISTSRDEATFAVLSVEGVNFPKDGDFININPSQGIKDSLENEQNNAGNIKIPMKVLPQPYGIHFKVGPNPFESGTSTLSLTESGISITSGTAIIADFRANLKEKADMIKAEISIFDAVGNLVGNATESRSNKGILEVKRFTNVSTKVFFVWSGYNKSGRRVGSGSYEAIVRIVDPSGNRVIKKYTIGIKNKS